MKTNKTYDISEIYRKLTSNEIPQSFVDEVLKHYDIQQQTEEEKQYADSATPATIFSHAFSNNF